jgi:hypothetical protein
LVVVDRSIRVQCAYRHRDVHVAQLWRPTNEARALGGEERNAHHDVEAVVFVYETQFGHFTLRNGERVSFAGSLRALALSHDQAGGALQSGLGWSSQFGRT